MSAVLPVGSKILVGMSGGVDSSVAAALLLKQGYQVVGGFIKNWSDSKDLWTGECQWKAERRDALRVAAKLGISLLTFDFEEEYRARVLDRMFREYQAGRTPNPDILCNQEIKFGLFYEAAMRAGFDGVATGHYAQSVRDANGVHLAKAVDAQKDQTYFLQRMSREALQRTLFPVGGFEKADVRVLAEEFGLSVARKPDSQGICFVGKLDFHEFLRKRLPPVPGPILDEEGSTIGTHDGIDAYTIGQRHGLHVSVGQRAWYVAQKDRARNALVMVPEADHPLLFRREIVIEEMHWLDASAEEAEVIEGEVMIRYRQRAVPARLERIRDGMYRGVLAEPVWAPAAGQSAAVYQGGYCLGGGILAEDTLR
ncbi:tRNA 2-thiouridine(34) synthase MnmA [Patescibacteria group bacterium]|nr:tRNA 2-thiouridine(34) synthase MnmA [Patescibacteria group bacterium]